MKEIHRDFTFRPNEQPAGFNGSISYGARGDGPGAGHSYSTIRRGGLRGRILRASVNAWQATASDVNDPGNLGVGDMTYGAVVGNVGARDVFTMKGGASIQARRIGAPPKPRDRVPAEQASRP